MPQLVNSSCVHCRERISSMLNAEFCPACGNPVHHDCKRTGDPSIGECANCGADPTAGAALKRAIEEERLLGGSQRVPSHTAPGDGVLQVFGFLVTAAGVGLLLGNMTGVFPTIPFAGFVTMTIGAFMVRRGGRR